MYLFIIINRNLILCDHDNQKINNNTEFSLKIVTIVSFLNKLCHFTINVLIDIKFSSWYASEFIHNNNNIYLKSTIQCT